ncbi:ShlB/FhaC/HecB family hemolysin secretion/activation protein [Azospirillum brasilense]|uniref:ShlB/FhaC/HecB family hemolysin secretion/activation protein n=1 Tax=Azospirillum brasilense TaxID=192 RepID=UPI001586067A|nr:ShlB/FhaC/HecB family hemolysin secretion/activation protein [Azospirillum brasilense]
MRFDLRFLKLLLSSDWRRHALTAFIVATAAGSAHAQSASQITPPSFEPSPPARGGEILIPDSAGPEAPAGADALFVDIAGVTVEGGLPELRAQEQAIGGELVGKRVSAAELFAAARRLEQAYIAAGYGLARVVLPAQRLKDGAVLRLVVIDGYVERVDTDALPEAIRRRVADLLAPLVGRRGLTMDIIERRLLLAGDTPGTLLRSTLAPGSKPGATVLTVEARHQPVTGFLAGDNTLAEELGTYTASVGLDLNSPTGQGELIYLRASGWPSGGSAGLFADQPRNRTLAAGVTVPLGDDGLTANLELTDARATPTTRADGFGSTSVFSRVSARLHYPLIRNRDLTLSLQTAFDAEQERVSATGPVEQDLSIDRLRVLRGGGSLVWYAPGNGLVTARLTGSFGIGGLGARQAPPNVSTTTPLSRQGADPVFQKLDVSAGYTQPLLPHLAVDLAARAQTAFNHAMANAEQISLTGTTALSSLASGTLQGDSGFVLRGELQFPVSAAFTLPSVGTDAVERDAGAVLSPYLFGAYGNATLARPTALETGTSHGTAYGLGLRVGAAQRASFSAVHLNLEYGLYRLGQGAGDGQRLIFISSLQF